MKIVVLGSNSFSGSHLVDYLLENTSAEIIGISRSPENDPVFLPYLYQKTRSQRFRFFQFDINKDRKAILELFDSEKPEIIVNYAAQGEVRTSWKYPEQWFQTNTMAFVGLLTELKDRKYIRKYIQASTPEVYGSCDGRVKENFNYLPSTPYAVSKAACDMYLVALAKSFNFPVVMTRAANVYGIHQQLYRIIPRTIIYLKLGKTIELHGGGNMKRGFIHIRDDCDAVLKIINSERPSLVYHLSPDDGLRTIRDIVKYICHKTGHDFSRSTRDVDAPVGQDTVYDLDSSLAKRELGWSPKVSFEAGVDETIRWIDDNWDVIKDKPFEYIHKE